MWTTLRDHPEILYGAALALVIVVLLTPAVGGMARLLGAVDRARRPIPRLGGLALFFGMFVPMLAFLNLNRELRGLLLGMAVATTVDSIAARKIDSMTPATIRRRRRSSISARRYSPRSDSRIGAPRTAARSRDRQPSRCGARLRR